MTNTQNPQKPNNPASRPQNPNQQQPLRDPAKKAPPAGDQSKFEKKSSSKDGSDCGC